MSKTVIPQSQLESPPLGQKPYPKKWLVNLLFMKRVMKELYSNHFWNLQVKGVTSRGVWCTGSFHAWNYKTNQVQDTDFIIFYRHKQKPEGLNAKDTNWRLMWNSPASRRIARKLGVEAIIDDAIFATMNKVRAMEAREALNA